jgi:hypothetical protein
LKIFAFVTVSALSVFFGLATFLSLAAETVDVKYQGKVDLDSFDCSPVKTSSLVKRLCYDAARLYVVVRLKETYYHYCAVDPETVTLWRAAPSLGRYYIKNVKGGQFDCRVNGVPD